MSMCNLIFYNKSIHQFENLAWQLASYVCIRSIFSLWLPESLLLEI